MKILRLYLILIVYNPLTYLLSSLQISAFRKGKKIKPNTTEPKGCGIKRVVTPPKN